MMATPCAHIELQGILAARLGLSIPLTGKEWLAKAWASARMAMPESSEEAILATLDRESVGSDLWQDIVDAVTIHETHFLRHKEWFDEFERHVLLPLIEERTLRGPREIRIWSAGCATGEEPYTLAMMIDRLLPERRSWTIKILGTDISATTLDAARRATYRNWALRELSSKERADYFTEIEPRIHQLAPVIRDMVTFEVMNLVDPSPGTLPGDGTFDIIFCRNVLMYWAPETQRRTAAALGRCLAPGGWLIVSPVEAVAEWYRPLHPHNFSNAIFFQRGLSESGMRGTKQTSAPKGAISQGITPTRIKLPKPASRPRPVASAIPAASDDDTRIARARALADRGLLQKARVASEALIAADALDSDAYLLLASICEEQGDVAAAFDAARRAVYLAPESVMAHFRLGAALAAMGQVSQARRSFTNVLGFLQWQPDAAAAAADVTVGVLRYTANAYLTDTRLENDHG